RASPSRAAELASSNIRLATCEEVLTESDFVSIHLPLDASTRGLFDAERLARTKPGAFLINLARGGVVIDQALFDALHSGHLAGAGVDVHELEGEGEISPLATLPNVILTPHMGAGTIDSQRRIGERVIAIVTEHDRECKSGHI
ncbi:MAG: hydroxyacid dehydrogenase, partial [bacterium]|nr:hydroxyacid dehydrogenase [bacterium]